MACEEVSGVYSMDQFRHKGLLWAINRMVFHPRGYALALVIEDDDSVSGWQILGDGCEIWSFGEESDDEGFEKFNAFMNDLHVHAGEEGVPDEDL